MPPRAMIGAVAAAGVVGAICVTVPVSSSSGIWSSRSGRTGCRLPGLGGELDRADVGCGGVQAIMFAMGVARLKRRCRLWRCSSSFGVSIAGRLSPQRSFLPLFPSRSPPCKSFPPDTAAVRAMRSPRVDKIGNHLYENCNNRGYSFHDTCFPEPGSIRAIADPNRRKMLDI